MVLVSGGTIVPLSLRTPGPWYHPVLASFEAKEMEWKPFLAAD
jgi:hypothetical protein